MIRRVLEQGYHTIDRERLITITIFESEAKKEDVKAVNGFSKRHSVLICDGQTCEFKR